MSCYWREHDESLTIAGNGDLQLQSPAIIRILIEAYRSAVRDHLLNNYPEIYADKEKFAIGDKAIQKICRSNKELFGQFCMTPRLMNLVFETMFDEEFPETLKSFYKQLYLIASENKETSDFEQFYKYAVMAKDEIKLLHLYGGLPYKTEKVMEAMEKLPRKSALIYARLVYLSIFSDSDSRPISGKTQMQAAFNNALENEKDLARFIDMKGLIFDGRRFIDAVLDEGPGSIDKLLKNDNSFVLVKLAFKQAQMKVEWLNALGRSLPGFFQVIPYNHIWTRTYMFLAREFPEIADTEVGSWGLGIIYFSSTQMNSMLSELSDEDQKWLENKFIEKFPNLPQESFFTNFYPGQTIQSFVILHDHISLSIKQKLFEKTTNRESLLKWAAGLASYRKNQTADRRMVAWFAQELRGKLTALDIPKGQIDDLLNE